jgi:hypothetical protein
MTSIGYTNAIGGFNTAYAKFAKDPKSPGGAIKGWIPQPVINGDRRYPEWQNIRFTLTNAWNTTYASQLKRDNLKRPIVGPFRATQNAGDLLCRENYSCGGSCQTPQFRPNVYGLKQRFGATSKSCNPSVVYNTLQLITNIPSATCNGKWVYDSSDYTKYLKQQAVNKNFNDLTFGGDQSNGSQSAIRRSRRGFG